MIQYEIEFSNQAKIDYENFSSYEITHPDMVTSELKDMILSLDTLPERFPFYEEEPWIQREVRIMTKNDFGVFFQIDKEKKIVYIIRILRIQRASLAPQFVVSSD